MYSASKVQPYFLFVILILLSFSAQAAGYLPKTVLVKYKGADRPNIITAIAADTAHHSLGNGLEEIFLRPGISVEEAIAKLKSDPGISFAQPNYVKHVQAVPNDPLFNVQWAIKNDGQAILSSSGGMVSGFIDDDIDADVAWSATTGDPSIVVAVIDSGIDYTHPDLINNLWHNPNETKDGLDDDGNGYIDDVSGWDFVHNDNDPVDLNGHGTHVAGIIAAQGDNGSTVAGVSWHTSLMPLQVVDADGVTTSSAIVSAIHYAADNGARIINASYGETTYDQAEYDAIAYANSKGVLVVAAACNDGRDIDMTPCYPASYDLPNIIAVAASDQFDNRAVFSSWGAASVDLFAPGVSIISTYPTFDQLFTALFSSGASGWSYGGVPNTWAVNGGTLQDSPGGSYTATANNWAMSPAINLSGRGGCRVATAFASLSLQDNVDTLLIEGSSDGTNWSKIGEVLTSAQAAVPEFYADASAFDNAATFYFRFRLMANGDGVVNDGVAINSASVDCYTTQTQSGYAYLDGTSVAAPFVTGTAALLLAQFGNLTVTQLRNRIINNVDTKSTLIGLSVSSGRLNTAKALGLAGDNPGAGIGGGGGGVSPGLLAMLSCLFWYRRRDEGRMRVERTAGMNTLVGRLE